MNRDQASVILYALAGFVMVLCIGVAIHVSMFLTALEAKDKANEAREKANIITPENAGTVVRQWLDDVRLTVKLNDDPPAVFSAAVTSRAGRNMTVLQLKEQNQYLVVLTRVTADPATLANLTAAPPRERAAVLRALHAQLVQLGFLFGSTGPPFSGMSLKTEILITPTLSKDEFIKRLSQFDQAVELIIEALSTFN